MIRHKAIGAAAAVIAVVVAGVVFAHEGMTGAGAQRMEGMKSMAADLKAISRMVESSTDLDVGELRARVGALHRNCHDAKGLFVAAEHDKTSQAMPAVWEHPYEFAHAMQDFDTAVKEPEASAAGGERAAISRSLTTVGRTCSACHQVFRRPD